MVEDVNQEPVASDFITFDEYLADLPIDDEEYKHMDMANRFLRYYKETAASGQGDDGDGDGRVARDDNDQSVITISSESTQPEWEQVDSTHSPLALSPHRGHSTGLAPGGGKGAAAQRGA